MTLVERRQLWQQRLAEQAASGLTQNQWCDAKGINRRQFKGWHRRLTFTTSEARWVGSSLQTTHLPLQHEFPPVRVGAATIEVQAGFSPLLLTQVVHAIASR